MSSRYTCSSLRRFPLRCSAVSCKNSSPQPCSSSSSSSPFLHQRSQPLSHRAGMSFLRVQLGETRRTVHHTSDAPPAVSTLSEEEKDRLGWIIPEDRTGSRIHSSRERRRKRGHSPPQGFRMRRDRDQQRSAFSLYVTQRTPTEKIELCTLSPPTTLRVSFSNPISKRRWGGGKRSPIDQLQLILLSVPFPLARDEPMSAAFAAAFRQIEGWGEHEYSSQRPHYHETTTTTTTANNHDTRKDASFACHSEEAVVRKNWGLCRLTPHTSSSSSPTAYITQQRKGDNNHNDTSGASSIGSEELLLERCRNKPATRTNKIFRFLQARGGFFKVPWISEKLAITSMTRQKDDHSCEHVTSPTGIGKPSEGIKSKAADEVAIRLPSRRLLLVPPHVPKGSASQNGGMSLRRALGHHQLLQGPYQSMPAVLHLRHGQRISSSREAPSLESDLSFLKSPWSDKTQRKSLLPSTKTDLQRALRLIHHRPASTSAVSSSSSSGVRYFRSSGNSAAAATTFSVMLQTTSRWSQALEKFLRNTPPGKQRPIQSEANSLTNTNKTEKEVKNDSLSLDFLSLKSELTTTPKKETETSLENSAAMQQDTTQWAEGIRSLILHVPARSVWGPFAPHVDRTLLYCNLWQLALSQFGTPPKQAIDLLIAQGKWETAIALYSQAEQEEDLYVPRGSPSSSSSWRKDSLFQRSLGEKGLAWRPQGVIDEGNKIIEKLILGIPNWKNALPLFHLSFTQGVTFSTNFVARFIVHHGALSGDWMGALSCIRPFELELGLEDGLEQVQQYSLRKALFKKASSECLQPSSPGVLASRNGQAQRQHLNDEMREKVRKVVEAYLSCLDHGDIIPTSLSLEKNNGVAPSIASSSSSSPETEKVRQLIDHCLNQKLWEEALRLSDALLTTHHHHHQPVKNHTLFSKTPSSASAEAGTPLSMIDKQNTLQQQEQEVQRAVSTAAIQRHLESPHVRNLAQYLLASYLHKSFSLGWAEALSFWNSLPSNGFVATDILLKRAFFQSLLDLTAGTPSSVVKQLVMQKLSRDGSLRPEDLDAAVFHICKTDGWSSALGFWSRVVPKHVLPSVHTTTKLVSLLADINEGIAELPRHHRITELSPQSAVFSAAMSRVVDWKMACLLFGFHNCALVRTPGSQPKGFGTTTQQHPFVGDKELALQCVRLSSGRFRLPLALLAASGMQVSEEELRFCRVSAGDAQGGSHHNFGTSQQGRRQRLRDHRQQKESIDPSHTISSSEKWDDRGEESNSKDNDTQQSQQTQLSDHGKETFSDDDSCLSTSIQSTGIYWKSAVSAFQSQSKDRFMSRLDELHLAFTCCEENQWQKALEVLQEEGIPMRRARKTVISAMNQSGLGDELFYRDGPRRR